MESIVYLDTVSYLNIIKVQSIVSNWCRVNAHNLMDAMKKSELHDDKLAMIVLHCKND